MKCLVAVKRVVDPYVSVRVRSDNSGVETANVKMAMNPFDEIAIEEAVQLKEKGIISEIIAVSIGSQACQEILRQALARGADKAILIEATEELQPLAVSKVLQKVVEQQAPELVFLGKQAIDNDCNQTGQMLAARLGWAQGTFASKIELNLETKKALVTREVDGGLETLSLALPLVLTTDLRLNEPRYISLPNVMQAKKKPLEVLPISELSIELPEGLKTLKVEPPEARKAGIRVETVSDLVDKLKNEARVI